MRKKRVGISPCNFGDGRRVRDRITPVRLQRVFGLGSNNGKLLIFLHRNHPKDSCEKQLLRFYPWGKKKETTCHTPTPPHINSDLLCDPGLSKRCLVHLKQFRDTLKLNIFWFNNGFIFPSIDICSRYKKLRRCAASLPVITGLHFVLYLF